LIDELVKVAQEQGCYKVILDCAENNVDFYGKCGLTRKEVQMVRDTAAGFPCCPVILLNLSGEQASLHTG